MIKMQPIAHHGGSFLIDVRTADNRAHTPGALFTCAVIYCNIVIFGVLRLLLL